MQQRRLEYVLRPVTPADRPFLWELKVQTMKPYIEQTFGWDEPTAQRFLDRTMVGAQLVLVDGRPAGLLKLVDRDGELYLAEIALRPALQRRGLGTQLIRACQAEAQERGMPLQLQVLKVNPARRLYERLGFVETGETATHILMRWQGEPALPG